MPTHWFEETPQSGNSELIQKIAKSTKKLPALRDVILV